MEKCKFGVFFKLMFSYSRKACFLHKTSKIVFSRFIFTIFYIRIQGIRRGYKGFKGGKWGDNGVAGGYKGLQEVTGGYQGSQGVTRVYSVLQRNGFLTRTSPDTLKLGVFCIKIKIE